MSDTWLKERKDKDNPATKSKFFSMSLIAVRIIPLNLNKKVKQS